MAQSTGASLQAGAVAAAIVSGDHLNFKTSATHRQSLTLFEAIEPPGSGAGLHRLQLYETHIICEGQYEVGSAKRCCVGLGPGEMFFCAARHTAQASRASGPRPGRELMISSPGGIFEASRGIDRRY